MVIVNSRIPIVDEEALQALVKARRIYAGLNLIRLRKALWFDPALRGSPNLLVAHGSRNVSETWHEQVARNVATQLLRFFGGKQVRPQLTLEQIAKST